jgi:hypothetical protein
MTGDLSACKSQTNFDTTINRQQKANNKNSKNIFTPPQKIIIRVLTHRKIIYHGA